MMFHTKEGQLMEMYSSRCHAQVDYKRQSWNLQVSYSHACTYLR